MNANEWAGLIVSVATIVVSFGALVRWLVKHYLAELKPNGGSSVSDRLNRVEDRVDEIYTILCERK